MTNQEKQVTTFMQERLIKSDKSRMTKSKIKSQEGQVKSDKSYVTSQEWQETWQVKGGNNNKSRNVCMSDKWFVAFPCY